MFDEWEHEQTGHVWGKVKLTVQISSEHDELRKLVQGSPLVGNVRQKVRKTGWKP
jgi:hypothetical protein